MVNQTIRPIQTDAPEEDVRQQSIPSFTPRQGRSTGRGRGTASKKKAKAAASRAAEKARAEARARAEAKAQAIRAAAARATKAKQEAQIKERSRIERVRSLRQKGRVIETGMRGRPGTIKQRRLKDLTRFDFKPKRFITKFEKPLDIVLGGSLTQKRINKDKKRLDKSIGLFNKRFGGRELSEGEFNQAQRISSELNKSSQKIDTRQEKLSGTKRVTVTKSIGSFGSKVRTKEEEKTFQSPKNVALRKTVVSPIKKKLNKTNEKLKTAKGPNKFRLKAIKFVLENRISGIESGAIDSSIVAGTFPIIPAVSIPSGVTKISLLGKRRVLKNGKIITDIVFKTSKGVTGVAKGVTINKGSQGTSVVLGRTGKVFFKLPSGKKKIRNIRSFIGVEKVKSKTKTFSRVLGRIPTGRRRKEMIIVRQNFQALEQRGIGKIATVRGKKFITRRLTGKRKPKRKISLDDFASISAVLTKKDLSVIIGKSITGRQEKAVFIGLIKDVKSGVGKNVIFTASQKQQFQQATQKVLTSVSSALAKAEQQRGVSKSVQLASAVSLIKSNVARGRVTTSTVKPRVIAPILKQATTQSTTIKNIISPTTITGKRSLSIIKRSNKKTTQLVKQSTKVNTQLKSVTTVISKTQNKTKLRTLQKQKLRLLTKQRFLQRQVQRQVQNQKLRLKQVQKQVQKQKGKFRARVPTIIPRIPRGIKIPLFKKKKKKRITKAKQKKKTSYNVFARPTRKRKGQRRPKQIKVNRDPLTKRRAKDVRNFIVDHSLSRRGSIRKTRGSPGKSKLKVPLGYAKRTAKKFRRHKTVKGKRKLLPKNSVIEKRIRLLDTRSERRGITLRKKIMQISPKKRKVKKGRRPKRKR